MTRLPRLASLVQTSTTSSPRNCASSMPITSVRGDFVGGVTFVDGWFEDLHALPRDLCAAQTADQLFALAGKHRANDDFDPAHIAFDDVHDDSSILSNAPATDWHDPTGLGQVYRVPIPVNPQRLQRGTSSHYRTERTRQARQLERLPGA